ncbi:hypothetical protein JXR93_05295, partial [bacterium]|nr:hypothetical protein [bacterium]
MRNYLFITLLFYMFLFYSCGEEKNITITNQCENVVCDSWKSCNSLNGLCELKSSRCDSETDCLENFICDENHNCINSINPCEGVTCSNHGSCSIVNNIAICSCENGYVIDGLNCVDINECSLNTDNCHENADCTNQDGSFSCECKTGFSGDGVNSCEEITIDLCENVVCDSWKNCNSLNGLCELKSNCCDSETDCLEEQTCDENHNCINSVNPCEGVTCSNNGSCSIVNNIAICSCENGYVADGLNCVDINECSLNTDNCQSGFNCVNSEGSF